MCANEKHLTFAFKPNVDNLNSWRIDGENSKYPTNWESSWT